VVSTGSTDGRGSTDGQGARRFVVQRHRATRDHYDLRFEVGTGDEAALASWAVPKGPTLDPGKRRSAFQVEDHPMEYFDFEGVIPNGTYGAGDVIVWDWGTYEPHGTDDPAAAIASGELHVDVHGEKLRGRFALVHTGSRQARSTASEDNAWLLVHKRDEYAVEGWEADDHPRSVKSGRTNDEVRADPDREWHSDRPPAEASVALRFSGPTDDELAALDDLGDQGTWSIHGRDLKVTNLDKVLFPAREGEQPVTKRDLLRYAAQIGPTLVPYLTGRALNMHRYPNGAGSKGFWHKERPAHAPQWLGRWDNPQADYGETTTYVVVDEPAALVWVANFGALEWHAWTSTTDRPDLPTYALVDLDPGPATTWEELLELARLHRAAFEHVGVSAFPKVTGRRGIQVWVPIERGPTFEETRTWVEKLSKTVGAVLPDLVSWKWEVRSRGGKARLDYTQNAVNKTLVAPYSPRPASGAPVSMPITWDELDDAALRPDRWTVRSAMDRIGEVGDLFRPVLTKGQTLPGLG
jgi:bifunctional non-homologous end joining protein LigD